CAELLAAHGFEVTAPAHGLETAFRATIGSGPVTVAIACEYDALPGLGHACGHNLIAAAGVGAALGLAPYADELGLTVRVIGTPAEERGAGKALLLEAGAFDGVDAAMMVHPCP
ncbi:M20 family metallopeptidase, partial [Streptomyces sp. SID8455]|nr:M20 family metallopeptidase [Streptomyces sp. SID8455]